jgi:hypothetical protein
MPRQDAGALQASVGYVSAALAPGSSRLVVEIAVAARAKWHAMSLRNCRSPFDELPSRERQIRA